jgi:hypothetical protein
MRTCSSDRRSGSRPVRWLVALTFIVFLASSALWILWLRYDLRSYSLLIHFVDPQSSGALVHWESNGVTARDVVISTPSGLLKARLYSPEGIPRPPGMVVVHGIHHLGMEEPRLVAFSRAVAQSGFAVLTPQLDALADYHVEASSISFIGESAKWLEQQLGGGPVTVTGVSFAGGISLLAACDPAYAVHIRALVLMGPTMISPVSRASLSQATPSFPMEAWFHTLRTNTVRWSSSTTTWTNFSRLLICQSLTRP